MKTHPFFDRLSKLLLAAVTVSALSACTNNPVEGEDDHPVGMVLVNAQGVAVVTVAAGPTVTGQLTATVNGTQTYTVFAISENGTQLSLDGAELAVRVASQPQNATVTLQGANQLAVTGRTTGSGSMRLELLHGGHAELAGNITVGVQ